MWGENSDYVGKKFQYGGEVLIYSPHYGMIILGDER